MKTTKLPDEHVETITVETHNDWNVFILRQSTIGNAQRPAVDNSIVMTQDQLAKLVATQQNAQADVEACHADHGAFQRMRHCPKYCPACGERLHSR